MKKKYFNDKMQNIRNDGSFFFIIDLGYTRVNLPIYIYIYNYRLYMAYSISKE